MATPGWTEKKRSSAPMRRGSVPQKIYWEGINLNKISKKIVSLVTVAALATTLVPAAAFAGTLAENDAVTLDQQTANTVNVQFNEDASNVVINVKQGNAPVTTEMLDKDGTPSGFGNTGSTIANVYEDTSDYRLALSAGAYTIEITENGTPVLNEDVYIADETDAEDSALLTYDDNNKAVKEVTVNQGEPATVEFDVKDVHNNDTTLPLDAGSTESVIVWATQNNTIVNNVTFGKVNATDAETVAPLTGYNDNVWVVTGTGASNAVLDGDQITATFTASGTYEIHAAVVVGYVAAGNNPDTVFANLTSYAPLNNTVKVNVEKPAVVTNSVVFDKEDANGVIDVNDKLTPSGTNSYAITGTAYEGTNDVAENTTLSLVCDDNGDGITVPATFTTDEKGRFSFNVTLNETGLYTIEVINEENAKIGEVDIDHSDVDAASIKVTKEDGTLLAGTDKTYARSVYATGEPVYLSDAVQYEITDVYGQKAEGDLIIKDELAAIKDSGKNLTIVDKPEATDDYAASTLSASDLVLAWDEANATYTLKYVGGNDYATDLVPGEYTVRVALNNGGDNAVDVSFTLAEFGDVEDLVFDMTASPAGTNGTYQNDSITAIDDEVMLAQDVTAVLYYVDANGVKVPVPAKNWDGGVYGNAVKDTNTNGGVINFTTRDNIPANESLIGTTITVSVVDDNLGLVTKNLTVVSAYQNETLEFDSTQGAVGEDNPVNVTVVDEDGNLSKVNGTLTATLVSQSNEEAKIDVDVNRHVRDGEGLFYVESDAEGTADIVVAVKADNGEMYAKTLTYTFGDEDPYAGTSVVMTIGSDQYLINNELFDGSVDNLGAPYVDSAWRTMVPVRVLAESFGAEVTFDEEAQTVTIVDGDTTIVMTVGSTEYTINGEAAEAMDTAPVIGSDNRTYVPVRFVAEGLGYEVTPLYNAENGTTASVVFQK